MTIRDILRNKGSQVLSIHPDATLADVVQKLVQNNCGSLVVCDGDRMAGIITERDILRAVADGTPLSQVRVHQRMTTEVVTGTSDDSVESIMGAMTEHRIRHMPILDNQRLVGLISIGDVVKAQHDQLSVENHYLLSYIQGE